jgi:hypothetical protein
MQCGCVGKHQRQYWCLVKDEKGCGKASVQYFKIFFKDPLTFVTTLLAFLTGMFMILNIFLGFTGADTSVSIFTVIGVFLLWTCVSASLVFVGSYFGFCLGTFEVSTKTNHNCIVHPRKECSSKKYCYSSCKQFCPLHQHDCRVCHHYVRYCVWTSLFALIPTS